MVAAAKSQLKYSNKQLSRDSIKFRTFCECVILNTDQQMGNYMYSKKYTLFYSNFNAKRKIKRNEEKKNVQPKDSVKLIK